jgi:hypothetical protein
MNLLEMSQGDLQGFLIFLGLIIFVYIKTKPNYSSKNIN